MGKSSCFCVEEMKQENSSRFTVNVSGYNDQYDWTTQFKINHSLCLRNLSGFALCVWLFLFCFVLFCSFFIYLEYCLNSRPFLLGFKVACFPLQQGWAGVMPEECYETD